VQADVLQRVTVDPSAFVVTNEINGTFAAETLDGTAEADLIDAGNRNDIVNGNDGGDVIFGGFGVDTIDGGRGDDLLNGDGGNDIVTGGNGNDTINGGDQNDDLSGDRGDDILKGGAGIDILNGGDGMDTLTGGAGRDTFVLDAGGSAADADTVTDFTTADRDLSFINAGGKAFVFEQVGNDVTASADGVLIATLLNANVTEVINNSDFDASPASVLDGTPVAFSKQGAASASTTQLLAEDAAFAFVEAPLEQPASIEVSPVGIMPKKLSMNEIFAAEGVFNPLSENRDPNSEGLDPWLAISMMGTETLI